MKVAETKSTSAANKSIQKKQQPFFKKEGQNSFFSKYSEPSNSFFSPAIIQPKLTIGQPNDKYEIEANAMADHICMPMNSASSKPLSSGGPAIQAKCAACKYEEEKLQRKPLMIRSEGSTPVAKSALSSQLNSSKGSGSPLPSGTNSFMSSAFGTDFSNVRIHTGGNAVQMNQELNARAFTHGSDIYFNKGQYNPGTNEGKHLLAHELTHSIQQKGAPMIQKQPIEDRSILGIEEFPYTGRFNTQGTGFHHQARVAQSNRDYIRPDFNVGDTVTVLSKTPRNWLQVRRTINGEVQQGYIDWRYVDFVPLQVEETVEAEPQHTEPHEITGVAASVSWIHPRSPAGRMPLVGVPDPVPPSTISRSFITAANGFRFSNHTAASIRTNDGQTISNLRHDPIEITKGASQFGLPSQQYQTRRNSNRGSREGIEFVEITQLVGARTVSHEVAGERAGNAIGLAGGAIAGGKGGAFVGSFFGPLGTVVGGGLGGIGGGIGGFFLGGEVGEQTAMRVVNFPPIWTELKLRIYADGTIERSFIRNSFFPSVHYYGSDNYIGGLHYLALDDEQIAWENSGWNGGNPWSVGRTDGRD